MKRWLRPLAAALAALGLFPGLLPGALHAQERIDRLRIELAGPLEGARLAAGAAETTVDLSLAAGERRSLSVPLSVGSGPTPAGEPRFLDGAAASGARFFPEDREAAAPWSALPAGLRGRALPAIETERPCPDPPRLALLLAAVLVSLGLRRRPAAALGAGAVAAALVLLLPSPPGEPREVRVLEFDLAGERSLELLGGRDRLALPAAGPGWVRRFPASAELRLEVRVRGQRVEWGLRAPGARLYFQRERAGSLESALEELEPRRTWIREPGEPWRVQDGWSPGGEAPFTGVLDGPAPPGWLVSALPQGVRVLLVEAAAPGGRTTWVRAW